MVQQKKTPCKGGIYRITLLADGRTYIGRTTQTFRRRWSKHINELESGKHGNSYLQRVWKKYGRESFEFAILEPIKFVEDLKAAEERWMALYGSTTPDRGFNLLGSGELNVSPNPETSKNMSKASQARWTDPEFRAKMQNSLAPRFASPEYREQQRLQMLNAWADPEFAKKMARAQSNFLKSNPLELERRKQMLKTRAQTEEHRQRMSELGRSVWKDPLYRERKIEEVKERWRNPEFRATFSATMKAKWSDPEFRKNTSKKKSETQINMRPYDYEVTHIDGTIEIIADAKQFSEQHGINLKTFLACASNNGRMRNGMKVRKTAKIPQNPQG